VAAYLCSRYIETTALKEELASAQELALLDVREQGQYGEGHPFHAVNLTCSRVEFEAGCTVSPLKRARPLS
jgi:hypothetical protein